MKIFLKIFVGLLILLVLGVCVFLWTFDLNQYRDVITEKVGTALGRSVKIEDMELKLSLIPTVKVKGISISNPETFKENDPFVVIDTAEVTIAVMPFIMDRIIQVNDFQIGKASVNLVQNKNQNNWTFVSNSSLPSKKTTASVGTSATQNVNVLIDEMSVESISIQDLSVSYDDGSQKQVVQIKDFLLKQLKAISMTVVYNKQNIKLSGTLNEVTDLILQKPDYVFNLEVDAFNLKSQISGSIGNTKDFSNLLFNLTSTVSNVKNISILPMKEALPSVGMKLSATVQGDLQSGFSISPLALQFDEKLKIDLDTSVSSLMENPTAFAKGTISLSDPNLAQKFGLKPLEAQIETTLNKSEIQVASASLIADKSDLNLVANISLKDKIPFVRANISSAYFNPADLFAETQVSSEGTSVSKGKAQNNSIFSNDKIDFSALNLLNANILFQMNHLKLTDQINGYVSFSGNARLQDGLLTVDPLKVSAIQGIMDGSLRVNAKKMPAQISLSLQGENMKLDDVKGLSDILEGSVLNMETSLKTSGDSIKSFVNTLNGQIILEVTEGTIINQWFNSLPEAVGLVTQRKSVSYSTTDQESKLNCAAVNLNVKNGLIKMDKSVAIETSTINFAVSGDVDLPNEKLSVSMVPSVSQFTQETNNKLSLAQIIRIEGPFTQLKPKLDTQGIVKEAAQQGVRQLLDRVGEKTGIQIPSNELSQSTALVGLCEQALGRKPKGNVSEIPVVQPVQRQTTSSPSAEKTKKPISSKDQFKEELMKSIFDSLKK